jgi:hypothetical protein
MRRERIDLAHEVGVRRLRRWRSGALNTHRQRHLVVGQLADSRWFVDDTKDLRGARVCRDERDAYEVCDWLMAQSKVEWRRVPAEYDGRHEPTEPGWTATGQTWARDDEPDGGGVTATGGAPR